MIKRIWNYCTETITKRIISIILGAAITLFFGGGVFGGKFLDEVRLTFANLWKHHFNPEYVKTDFGYYAGDVIMENGRKVFHGKGKFVWNDGKWYDGEWVFGKKTGKGKYQWADGDWYDGQWLNDKRHGYGEYRNVKAKRSDIGDYQNDRRSGRGVMKWDSGDKYEGEWQDNASWLMEGAGIYSRADGTVEQGRWKDGKWTKEKLIASNTPVRQDFENGYYFGTLKDGKYHGKGELHLKDGNWYKGEYRNGKAHGKGTSYYAPRKRTDSGDYFDDRRKGYGEMTWENGMHYKGAWDDIDEAAEWKGTMYGNGKAERGKFIGGNWVASEKAPDWIVNAVGWGTLLIPTGIFVWIVDVKYSFRHYGWWIAGAGLLAASFFAAMFMIKFVLWILWLN
jgi:hypothetical protein